MSYMNDETDPFGIPYAKLEDTAPKKSKEPAIEYNLKDYNDLLNQKEEFEKTLEHLNKDIDDCKAQLQAKIHKICSGAIPRIDFERERIIVVIRSLSFSDLVQLKKELSLKDIEIKNDGICFKLYLIW